MISLEDKLLTAVLNDAQIHVLLQADAGKLFRTYGDVWDFIKGYYDQNQIHYLILLI